MLFRIVESVVGVVYNLVIWCGFGQFQLLGEKYRNEDAQGNVFNHISVPVVSTFGFGGGLNTSAHTIKFNINRIKAIIQKCLLNFMNQI